MYLTTLYIVITCMLAAQNVYIGIKAFHKKTFAGYWLGRASVSAMVVSAAHLVCIHQKSYLGMSIASSVYFYAMDFTVTSMVPYVLTFTQADLQDEVRNQRFQRGSKIFKTYLFLEAILFTVNVLLEPAVSYVYRSGEIGVYGYQFHSFVWPHLIFLHLIGVGMMIWFTVRMIKAPKEYKNQYLLTGISMLYVFIMNMVYLTAGNESWFSRLNFAPWGFTAVACVLYWSSFRYSQNGMLLQIKDSIFENIDQGLVIFDYRNDMAMFNKKAEEVLQGVKLDQSVRLDGFLKMCNLDISKEHMLDDYSFQCYLPNKNGETSAVRCYYKILKNQSDRLLGRIFVFTDMAAEMDLLTEFHNWASFKQLLLEKPESFRSPMTVSICDLNSLTRINASYGRDRGDQMIRALSQALREQFPKDSYFIRGNDANLLVLSYRGDEKEAKHWLDKVKEQHDIQYSISSITEEQPDILKAIGIAMEGMRARKLMDVKSTRSGMLTSLIHALKECDADTEAHVQRTQKMGILLGERIGLSDPQKSDLELLCVLHDIGKIGVPLDILNKPGRLTPEEWKIIQSHVEKGYQIALSSPALSQIADMIRYHHERWDGKGYPQGLKEDQIPLLSRVISVVDSFDAMISKRPYKKEMTVEEALEEIRRCSGTQFDPVIAAEFVQMIEEEQKRADGDSNGILQRTKTEDLNDQAETQNKGYQGVMIGTMTQAAELSAIRHDEEPGGEQVKELNNLLHSSYVLDERMRIIRADYMFEELTGYTEEDIRNRDITQMDLVPIDVRVEMLCLLSERFARDEDVCMQYSLQKKDGSKADVICSGRKHYDSAAREVHAEMMIMNMRDLSVKFKSAVL